ncbi:hypothetical protein [Leptolyngbya ohadii]|uniref:hypothetical protein n=1 Tax=Leptolyngbya ohadii TaxID=1962290 RepID=UPI000B599832|nr:hypothetical protein [Leptolyngbya ohadii]
MFIVDVALKNNPAPVSVQRKSEDDAKALYQQIVGAIQSGNPATVELSCEQQAGKTVCVLVSEIAAVQMAEKSGSATSSGRPPGFFALAE